MHIADGILSNEVCLGAGVLAAGAIGLSLRKLNDTVSLRTVPLTGMMAAVIFAAQMVKFPLAFAPAYGHLLGGVLAAIVVGPWAGCVAMAIVLFLQMALFADGGWLAYGANALNMGVVGSLGGHAIYSIISRRFAGPRGKIAGAVVAAWLSVVAGSALFSVEFALSHRGGEFDLPKLFAVMTTLHSLVGVGEALITGGVVSYLLAVWPDLIDAPSRPPGVIAGLGRVVWTGAVVALAVAAFLAPFASEGADALEQTAERFKFDKFERTPVALVLPDYEVPIPGVDVSTGAWHKLSVALAGVFGTSAVLGISLVLGRVARTRLAARDAEATHAG
ncbi:MAG: energy-coupling factor ABC transporter permease [Planctomycetia bacterium]|nr:energy-coupling factor ABC transporter permease [Planctomycetia bacterium]